MDLLWWTLAVALAFALVLWWFLRPARKERLKHDARLPLEDEPPPPEHDADEER